MYERGSMGTIAPDAKGRDYAPRTVTSMGASRFIGFLVVVVVFGFGVMVGVLLPPSLGPSAPRELSESTSPSSSSAIDKLKVCRDEPAKIADAFKRSKAGKEEGCFGWMYAELFAPFKFLHPGVQGLRLLEIGVDSGESLPLWRSALGEKLEVHGVENGKAQGSATLHKQVNGARCGLTSSDDADRLKKDPCVAISSTSSPQQMTIHVGSQADPVFLSHLVNATPGGFDIIIDDGGHANFQHLASIRALWPHVRPGGLYVIEDIETQYYASKQWGCYGEHCGGGPPGHPGTSIALLKSFIDVLNRDFHGGPSRDNKRWIIGTGKYSVMEGDDHTIASLTCFRNLCGVRKLRGTEFVTGRPLGCNYEDTQRSRYDTKKYMQRRDG